MTKEVEREVFVERQIERIVEVPVQVERIVEVEVPYEKIVYVQKEVYRDVYKDVPVPVQMSNERVVIKEVRLPVCEYESANVKTRHEAMHLIRKASWLLLPST